MNSKNRSRLVMLNSCLLICRLVLAGGVGIKNLSRLPSPDEAEKSKFRERINQTQDMELLRKKLVEVNDYILSLEQLVRDLRYTLIGVASAAAFFAAYNLVIIRKKD